MYTISEVADLLRISTVHVRELIREGRIKAVTLSPKVTRIPRGEIDRLTGAESS
ncbi:helix-turn-helix domain-containing protein [Dietzia cinnamea]|uniref:helix-turn-helix domain-containing protein n=1 Tax=Dietzia cinnamea TaxID=321318 RepID=UPI0035CCF6E8